jgi:hypothetical protein
MDAYDKLIKRYSSGKHRDATLPPPLEEEVEVDVPQQEPLPNIIENEKDSTMPMVDPYFDPSRIDLDFEVHKGLINGGLRHLLKARYSKLYPNASYNEIQELVIKHMNALSEKATQEAKTVAPTSKKSNLSRDQLVKFCDLYYKLAIR